MKRCVRSSLVILLVMISTSAFARTTMMSVQVKDGQVRANPSFLGQIVASLDYGDRVQVLETQGPWSKVSAPSGKTGWIHTSALTKKNIQMSAGDTDVQTGASGEELALAGKGFNSDVESEFKAQNRDVDFTWVDRMEKWKVDTKEMQRFLEQGGVKPEGGN